MPEYVEIAGQRVGDGYPALVVAEIGINHNGDLEIARKLIDVAAVAGCNAVKFQSRTPDLSVPPEQRQFMRETPWGNMTYLEYRHRVEFGREQYCEIDRYCKAKGILWFASRWDIPSVDFIEQFSPVCYKIASASLTDSKMLRYINALGRPIILSTGMSTMDEIRQAVSLVDRDRLIITHTTSTYPCKPEELNLRMIPALVAGSFPVRSAIPGTKSACKPPMRRWYWCVSWYSAISPWTCAMWGTDQAASVEPQGLLRLIRDIRIIEHALGDGQKLRL